MIEIIKEIDVEVTKPNVFQAIVAKQYDMNTRFLKVTLMDCGTRINVPTIETAKVVINAERKDGQAKGFDGVINDDGTVTVPLHSWMLELDGTVICDISVIDTATDDNKKLTTTSFTLIVEKAAFGGDDVTNDPQYDVLVSLLETCQNAGAVAQEALEKSNEANSKYAACVEATNEANLSAYTATEAANAAWAVRHEIEAGGFIESLKEQREGGKFTVWVGTNEEYEALEEKENNCLYITNDDEPVIANIYEHNIFFTIKGFEDAEQDHIGSEDSPIIKCLLTVTSTQKEPVNTVDELFDLLWNKYLDVEVADESNLKIGDFVDCLTNCKGWFITDGYEEEILCLHLKKRWGVIRPDPSNPDTEYAGWIKDAIRMKKFRPGMDWNHLDNIGEVYLYQPDAGTSYTVNLSNLYDINKYGIWSYETTPEGTVASVEHRIHINDHVQAQR